MTAITTSPPPWGNVMLGVRSWHRLSCVIYWCFYCNLILSWLLSRVESFFFSFYSSFFLFCHSYIFLYFLTVTLLGTISVFVQSFEDSTSAIFNYYFCYRCWIWSQRDFVADEVLLVVACWLQRNLRWGDEWGLFGVGKLKWQSKEAKCAISWDEIKLD